MSIVRGKPRNRGPKLRLEVAGDAALKEAIDGVKAGVVNRVFKGALRKIASAANKQIKAAAPKRSGLLKRSIGIKYRAYRRTGGFVFAVGARMSVVGVDADGLKAWPFKYAHLVEGGRKAVRPKKKKVMGRNVAGGFVFIGKFAAAVPAKPFIRPAYERIVTLSGSFLRSEVSAGIASEAAKYAAKGKSIRMGGGA